MRLFFIFISFLVSTGMVLTPIWAATSDATDTSDDEEEGSSDEDSSSDGSDEEDSQGAGDTNEEEDEDEEANDTEDEGNDEEASTSSQDKDSNTKKLENKKEDVKDKKKTKEKKFKASKKKDKTTSKKSASNATSLKMYGAKKNAICPRGLEDKDIREVFKGFSYEGFEKASTDGDMDLTNGLMRKPWGFYKGLDNTQYAVYAFKPEPTDVASIIDTDKLAAFKMLRIKIPEYCALYTEASPEASGGDKHEAIGLLISKATSHKPRPVDPGGLKTEVVRSLIKEGLRSGGMSSAQSSNKEETDDENILGRGKAKEKDSLIDTSEAKIFEKLNKPEESDADDTDSDDESDADKNGGDNTNDSSSGNDSSDEEDEDASSSDADNNDDDNSDAEDDGGSSEEEDGE